MGEPTIKELLDEVIRRLDEERSRWSGPAAREFSLAITAAEDAQMRATRGLAKAADKFEPADLQR